MSWTSALSDMKIGKLTRISLAHDISGEELRYYPLGAILFDSPPSIAAKSKAQGLAIDRLLMLHDTYMTADCESYGGFVGADDKVSIEYLITSLEAEVIGGKGVSERLVYPLLISPEIEAVSDEYDGVLDMDTIVSGSVQPEWTRIRRRSTRGLCSRTGVAITAGANPKETSKTLVHESIHLMHQCLSHLDGEMYGDDASAVTEEVITHIVTDHFEKLQTLVGLKVECEVREYKGNILQIKSRGKKTRRNYLRIHIPKKVSISEAPINLEHIELPALAITDSDRATIAHGWYNNQPIDPAFYSRTLTISTSSLGVPDNKRNNVDTRRKQSCQIRRK